MNIGRLAVVQLPGHTNEPGLANSTDDASANLKGETHVTHDA